MSQLSIQCGILNISQLHRPPRPVTGIAYRYLNHPIRAEENVLIHTGNVFDTNTHCARVCIEFSLACLYIR
jgi:hypothetical protein